MSRRFYPDLTIYDIFNADLKFCYNFLMASRDAAIGLRTLTGHAFYDHVEYEVVISRDGKEVSRTVFQFINEALEFFNNPTGAK